MFQFPGFASGTQLKSSTRFSIRTARCAQKQQSPSTECRMMGHYAHRVAPFGNLRIKACLTAPRSLSQLTASFFASQRQGIHRLPFLA